MTDKTDPRLDALTSALKVQWGKGWMNDDGQSPSDVLADLDAADRAAGIVRVDTNDEALVKWLGRREFPAPGGMPGYFTIGTEFAHAILAALREAAQ